jgi:hypothetical protein
VPTILDILSAVKAVDAPGVDVWWLGSRSRLHVGADQAQPGVVDLVVEGRPVDGPAHDRLVESLSRALGGAPVMLRFARSEDDTRVLFRLLTVRRGS